MRKVILFVIILCNITFTGCKRINEEAAVSSVPQSTPAAIYDFSEPDESEISRLQSEWESARESVVPADTEKEKSRAEEILEGMSLEEKAGQVIIARYPDSADIAAEEMAEYKFGGYTLYAKDFEGETPESITAELAEIAAENDIMPFFAVDEEGGEITRVSAHSAFAEENLPPLQVVITREIPIGDWTKQMSDTLKSAGINLNFAPVADVAENTYDYIYHRTAGLGYADTAEVIAEITENMNKQGIVSCLKHFPGYGSNVDTHTGVAVDSRSREDFETKDFLPFISGIEAGTPMIMVNHNIVEAFNSKVPASLAPEVHEVLRELGFEGIIITDDLGMDAIALYSKNPYAAAFLAGNDMLCASDGKEAYESVYGAVRDGRITEERLDESVMRIIEAKLKFGIIG